MSTARPPDTGLMRHFLGALDRRVHDEAPARGSDSMADQMLELADRMERHVISRLPGSAPVVDNGAWQMMLDAARLLRFAAGRRP
jgi:hypothetical protein